MQKQQYEEQPAKVQKEIYRGFFSGRLFIIIVVVILFVIFGVVVWILKVFSLILFSVIFISFSIIFGFLALIQLLLASYKTKKRLLDEGNTQYKNEQYEDALTTFEQVINLYPKDVTAYYKKGDVLCSLKRYEEALTTYDEALKLVPNKATIYQKKGEILHALRRHQEALVIYEQAIQLAPNDAAIYHKKGNVLSELKQYEEALAAYEQAIQLAPNDAAPYYNKSMVLEKLDRYEEALAICEQALQFDPVAENGVIAESLQSLRTRIETAQQFFLKAGFNFPVSSSKVSFIASAETDAWRERFPRGLYIRILFDYPLDHDAVQSIYHDAKVYSDHALVIINKQPETGAWMAIGGLRAEEKAPFVVLPIAESLIREGSALNEDLTFQNYVSEHLGKDLDPYDVRYPVSDAVSFFGRESLIAEALSALRLGHSSGLFGIQKMGKSSFLELLQKKSELPIAYVFPTQGDSLVRIFQQILEGWSKDSRIKYPNLKWSRPQFPENADPKMVFDSSAKDLLKHLERVTQTPLLGIFLDEVDNIVPDREGGEKTLDLYVNLMGTLRGMQHEKPGSLSLLFAGVHPTMARHNYFWGNRKNPMHQVISERFLLPLEREDCNKMVQSLGQQINLTYDDEALDEVFWQSGAHPFLARQLCSLTYKISGGNGRKISVRDIQKAAQEFVRDPSKSSYFDEKSLWQELGKREIWGDDVSSANHDILISLAASSVDLTETELSASLSKKTVERAMRDLKERGIISSSNDSDRYRITFGLFREWIRIHKVDEE